MFKRWFMPDNKIRCYSYIRWSSDKQETGTSLERQLEFARRIASENNLELVKIFDKGVSAFKSKNLEGGKLGAFIAAVKEKYIPSDSWLVVENLDRLSRDTVLESMPLFIELLKLGLTIVTAMDNQKYRAKDIAANPYMLYSSLNMFALAHEESKKKQVRTYGNALSFIQRHQKGERSENGYAYAIKSVGSNIWWSDCSDGTVKPHPIYYDVAKEIIDLIVKGYGSYRVIKVLNDKYPPPRKNKHNSWSHNLISNFHKRKALFGTKEIKVDGVPYELKDYYPALIDEDTFYKLGHIKEKKTSKSTATKSTPLLSGLGILKCGHCGGSMYAFTHRAKPRYICGTGQQNQGCRAWSFNATWVEDTVLRLAANHVFRPHSIKEDMRLIEQGLNEELESKQIEVTNLTDAIAKGVKPNSIVIRINELDAEIVQIKKKIESSKQQKHAQLNETVEWGKVDEQVLDVEQHELRTEIRNKLKLAINKVSCIQIEERHIFFRIEFIDESSILAYRTPVALAFDGSAWIELGDQFGLKVEVSDEDKIKHYIGHDDSNELSENEQFKTELLQDEKHKHLANFIIEPPAECIGESDGYKYTGLFDIPVDLAKDFDKLPKQLLQDIKRVTHLIEWANGIKGSPKIIEDQYQVYKHQTKSRIVKKPKPDIYYIKGVKFDNRTRPAWITPKKYSNSICKQ